MLIKMRLYRRHDLDLIGLFANDAFNFEQTTANALRAYSRKIKDFQIQMPQTHNFVKSLDPKKSQVNIYLDDVKDADVIAFLQSIPSGNRNSFLKSVLRNYIERPYIDAFIGEMNFVDKNKNKNKTTKDILLESEKAYKDALSQKTINGSKNVLIEDIDNILNYK